MIFVIDNLKYDTDKMVLISGTNDNIVYYYEWEMLGKIVHSRATEVKLWRSVNGRWLLTYKVDYKYVARCLTEREAKNLLLKYDLSKYEELFGEIEEA